MIDGVLLESSAMVANGNYFLNIPQPPGEDYDRKTITFMIGDLTAAETDTWEASSGGELDLTAMSTPPGETVMVSLYEVGHSGVTGMATLTEIGDTTEVCLLYTSDAADE